MESMMCMQAEGIFRITPENSQEEHVREQLNRGVVPDDIHVHCLASLIKVLIVYCRSFWCSMTFQIALYPFCANRVR
jgi:hypothetical protein